MLHIQVIALRCQPWFGFVYSEDNISDGPSRADYALMRALCAEYRPARLPDLYAGWIECTLTEAGAE